MYINSRSKKRDDRTVVTIDGYMDVPSNDEAVMMAAVAQQPVSVAVCADSGMQFYSSGVINRCCEGLNHGVLIVGYGTDRVTGKDYWVVKNSWGEAWGKGERAGMAGLDSFSSASDLYTLCKRVCYGVTEVVGCALGGGVENGVSGEGRLVLAEFCWSSLSSY